jgi:trimethylamine:corrinoid methyltransferase-like protein
MIFTERGYVMYGNTKHINTVVNDVRIYLVFLQHFENKRFKTTAQTQRHNMACFVTSLPCSGTSSPADLPALIPVKL